MARRPSSERLLRLLALPPWVADHPGVAIAEAAEHFGVDPGTIAKDVYTLWVSGLPEGTPDSLVDFDAEEFERGRLRLTHPLGLETAVRLTREEALSLLLSLRVLRTLLGTDDDAAVPLTRATRLLEELLDHSRSGGDHYHDGQDGQDGHDLAARPSAGEPSGAHGAAVLATVRRALAGRTRLELEYVSATDARSQRMVDPLELVSDGSHLSLQAWCATARAERTFRLDRILRARDTGSPAAPHRRLRRPRLDDPGEDGGQQTMVASLHLAPSGRWLIEQIPVRKVAIRADGSLDVEVRGRDRAWLTGLVLSAGRHILSVEPSDLSVACARAARAALAADAAVHDEGPGPVVGEREGR